MTNLPEVIQAHGLSPKQLVAIEAYTDPTKSTFSNKSASAKKAGTTAKVFERPEVQGALVELERHRLSQADHLAEQLKVFVPAAALDLVRQLGVGQDLRMIDPEEVFGEGVVGVLDKIDADRLKGIVAHNKAVADSIKVRQKAQEMLFNYAVGTPEQRLRHIQEKRLPDETDLSSLSMEELEALGELIEMAQGQKKDPTTPEHDGVIEVDVVVEG